MNKITINDTEIEIYKGDITDTDCDALVIPTNSRLLPSGDLRCKALKKAGAKVQVECNKVINQVIKLASGHAVITSGGNLKSKYLIHAAGPYFGQKPEVKNLTLAIWNSLKLANERKVDSIVFPPLSIDMIGFNANICAKALLYSINKFVSQNKSNVFKKVNVCLENDTDYEEFEKILDSLAK